MASFMNCYKEFVGGNLVHPSVMTSDPEHIHLDDVEEMDVTWQMVMVVFKAKNDKPKR